MSSQSLPRPPSVDRILRDPNAAPLLDRYGRKLVTAAVRRVVEEIRAGRATDPAEPDRMAQILGAVAGALAAGEAPGPRELFNLSGTVLHTNLGRATLPVEAIAAMTRSAAGPTDLEYDLALGERGDRDAPLETLVHELTGAESATFVNNNAAAVLLTLNSLAEGREAIVSRGELVEIGGSFRIPDIMRKAGCTLVEIGTTNRTHARDYRDAVHDETALLLKVHTSNYSIKGFAAAVSVEETAAIAHASGLPLVVDLGSGTLVDLTKYGLPREPTVVETLQAGADLVTFSGDKLLGGPQCGFIVGRRNLVERVKRNPLKRALRVGKLTIAALDALLRLYRDPDRLAERLPTIRLLARPENEIAEVARRVASDLRRACGDLAEVSVVECMSQIGSGALPLDLLPSHGVALRPRARKGEGVILERMASAFRALPKPVIGRIHEGAFLLDCRCLEDTDAFLAQLDELELGTTA